MVFAPRIACATLIAIAVVARAQAPAPRPASQAAPAAPRTAGHPATLPATQPTQFVAAATTVRAPSATPATSPAPLVATRPVAVTTAPAPKAVTSAPVASAPAGGDVADLAVYNNDVIVFLGDDLTDTPRPTATNSYPTLVETFLTARYPSLRAHYINVGWSGDTVSRALLRLDRDVLSHKPTVVVICLGLNDAEYLPLDEPRLAAYGQGLSALVGNCREAGARVWLISPPSVDEDKGRKVRIQRAGSSGVTDLQAIGYNATLRRYAAVVRDIAAKTHSGFVDWFTDSMAARARGRAADPDFSLTINGLNPADRSHAMVAAGLLRAWGAKPIAVNIDLTWASGETKVSSHLAGASGAGTPSSTPATAGAGIPSRTPTLVQAQITAAGARRLVLRGLPLPWPMAGGQAGAMSGDWEAASMCQFVLRVADPPERGLRIRFDWPQGPAVYAAAIPADQLRAGFNLAGTEALNAAKEVTELFQLIGTKNYYHYGTWRKLALSPPREAELVEAHRKLIEAWSSYVAGTERIIFNQPKTFDLHLMLTEAVPVEHLPTSSTRPTAPPRVSLVPPAVPPSLSTTPAAPPPLPAPASASPPPSSVPAIAVSPATLPAPRTR